MEQTARQRREAWGRRHGWSLFGVLGLLLLSFALWALSEDRPAAAGAPLGTAAGFITLSLYSFVRRDRR